MHPSHPQQRWRNKIKGRTASMLMLTMTLCVRHMEYNQTKPYKLSVSVCEKKLKNDNHYLIHLCWEGESLNAKKMNEWVCVCFKEHESKKGDRKGWYNYKEKKILYCASPFSREKKIAIGSPFPSFKPLFIAHFHSFHPMWSRD